MALPQPLENISSPEFDYNILIDRLKGLRYPRNKIGALLKSGQIIRIKKGLYIKADQEFHHFVLANMIFGPSYVSEDSALAFYGLIPEQVQTTTSMTMARKKTFNTPVGRFTYETLPASIYPWGQTRQQFDVQRGFVIASPEKALVDRLWRIKGLDDLAAVRDFIFADMRLDEAGQRIFHLGKLSQLAKASGKPAIGFAVQAIREARKS